MFVHESVSRTESRLAALTEAQRFCVARRSEAEPAELRGARLMMVAAQASGRLTEDEAAALRRILSHWRSASLAERVVLWRALAEVAPV